jgi:GlpG protein
MRQIGTISDERMARRFEDYLLTKGIAASLEPSPEGWKVWVRHEDHLNAARDEFAAFTASPDAPAFTESERKAQELRVAEQARTKQANKNVVDVAQRWRGGMTSRAPVTTLLTAVSIAVFLFPTFNKQAPVTEWLSIVPYEIKLPNIVWVPSQAAALWQREPWRLVTPIFLHFNIIHILFNMMMLLQLGRVIESLRGSWRFALLVLVIAIPSNLAQYVWSSPNFGGMSGVVYGLFGYMWMKSRYDAASGFYVSQNTVVSMIAWFIFCLIGPIPIANYCHGVGLAMGMLIGILESAARRLR